MRGGSLAWMRKRQKMDYSAGYAPLSPRHRLPHRRRADARRRRRRARPRHGHARRAARTVSASSSTTSAPPSSTSRAGRMCWSAPCSSSRPTRPASRASSSSTTSACSACAGTAPSASPSRSRISGASAAGTHRLETPVGDRRRSSIDGDEPVAARERAELSARAEVVAVEVPRHRRRRRRRRLGRQLVLPGQRTRSELLELANVERLTDFTWRIRQALVANGITGRTARRSTTSNSSARRAIPRITAATSSSVPARPTTARPAAPAPARSSPVCSPTASSHPAKSGGRRASSAASSKASYRLDDDGKRHSAHHRRRPTSRRGDADPRSARSVLLGYPGHDVAHVVVIGGGVIGVACAHYLQQAGRRVTVLDQGRFGGACSHGNCGYVCPSHVLPLAGPGVSADAARRCSSSDAPLQVRPRLDPRCRTGSCASPAAATTATCSPPRPAIQALLQSSSPTLYDDSSRGEPLDCRMGARAACCSSSSTQKAFDALRRRPIVLLRDQFNEPARRIDADELAEVGTGAEAGHGGRVATTNGRPSAAGPADVRAGDDVLTSRGVTFRRTLHTYRVRRSEGDGASDVRPTTGRHRRPMRSSSPPGVDAVDCSDELGVQAADPAGQGLLAHDAAAGGVPDIPADLRGTPRGHHARSAAAIRIGSTMEFAGYDDDAQSARGSNCCADGGGGSTCTSPTASRCRKSGAAGGR